MTHWQDRAIAIFGLPSTAPEIIVGSAIILFVLVVAVVPFYAVSTYLERKLGADFQARVGPNRAGPSGVLQPLADLLKLFQKQAPAKATWFREKRWIMLQFFFLSSTVVLLPLSSVFLMLDADLSVFVVIGVFLVLALLHLLFGLAQSSISGCMGGIRAAAQVVAGIFPAFIALLCAGLRVGSFRWEAFANAQSEVMGRWLIFFDPFQVPAFAVFWISGLALLGIRPFDAAFSESDIHGGVRARLYGKSLVLYELGRFYSLFVWALFTVTVFLGAWTLPFGLSEGLKQNESWALLASFETLWVALKALLLILITVWFARANPRLRVDQVTDFSWKILSPIALLSLCGVAFWVILWRGV